MWMQHQTGSQLSQQESIYAVPKSTKLTIIIKMLVIIIQPKAFKDKYLQYNVFMFLKYFFLFVVCVPVVLYSKVPGELWPQ